MPDFWFWYQLEMRELMLLAWTITTVDEAHKLGWTAPWGSPASYSCALLLHWVTKPEGSLMLWGAELFPYPEACSGRICLSFFWELCGQEALVSWDGFSWCHLSETGWLHLVSEHLLHCKIWSFPSPAQLFSFCTMLVTLFLQLTQAWSSNTVRMVWERKKYPCWETHLGFFNTPWHTLVSLKHWLSHCRAACIFLVCFLSISLYVGMENFVYFQSSSRVNILLSFMATKDFSA